MYLRPSTSALSRRRTPRTTPFGALTAGLIALALVAAGTVAGTVAAAASPTQPSLVSATPAAYTPDIDNGTVYAITQVGNTVVVGGSFTSVTPKNGTSVPRNRVLAFDASTGTLSTTFAPSLDGTVNTLLPGPTANTVYVGGAFTNVGSTKSKGVALLDLGTGAPVSTFKTPVLNGAVNDLRLAGGHLLMVGNFTTVAGVAHSGIASLVPGTGALDPYVGVQLSGHHNYNGSGANGPVGARALDVSPDGTRAVAVGNFKNADGAVHDQIVLLDLNAGNAVVDPNWNTSQFSAPCASGAFDTYVEDVDFSPDGSYFAIAATGGGTFSSNIDGTRGLCDSATRWETSATGSNVMPTWVDYSGNDTFWSVAATGTAVYLGGHQRWVNNSQGGDNAGAGAVPRPGLVALDPVNGLPFSWNPGRNPRGAGAYALLATSAGLYVGSDTNYIGNYRYKRGKIAYLPLAGGSTPAATTTAQLPANLYQAGPLGNATNSNVLYRVNAGGPSVAATDDGPDWMADQSGSDAGSAYHNSGSSTAGFGCCATLSSSVPASTPAAIFNTERYDGGSNKDGNEMRWTFPVSAGTNVGVRLYFANRYSGTSQAGQRVFDVAINGSTVLDHYDISADVGDQVATMKQFSATGSDSGTVTIDWTHEVENPNLDGIEIVRLDPVAPSTATVHDLAYHPVSGSRIGDQTTVANTGIDWATARGTFAIGNSLYWGDATGTGGTFYRASFDGTTVGTPVALDPYNDPAWSGVKTGSGQTYQGSKSSYYSEIPSITGQFYSGGRIYYSLIGQSALYWRWFEPESGVIGSSEFTVAGKDFSAVAGMTLSGTTLYYANRNDGSLHTIPFGNGTPDPTQDATVSAPGVDWRARSLFLFGKPTFPNQPPSAAATVTCTGLGCRFDATASTDPDGSIASYRWDFGDGASDTGATTSHGYAAAGSPTVTLTVTDDRGATSTWSGSASPDSSGPAIGYVGASGYNGLSGAPTVSVPAGVNAGDTELLVVAAATAGVTGTPNGWTQLSRTTNSNLETTVFRRSAQAGDAGARVTVPLTAAARADVQIVAYSGVAAAPATITSATDTATATHVAPPAAVTTPGSWVVSYWADRSSTTTAWTPPATVTSRQSGVGTGSGRVSSLLGDSNGAVATGTCPARSATTDAASARGASLSLVLMPAG